MPEYMNLKELVLSLVNDCLKLKLNISNDYKEIEDLIVDRCWSVSDYALCKTAVYPIYIKAQCRIAASRNRKIRQSHMSS